VPGTRLREKVFGPCTLDSLKFNGLLVDITDNERHIFDLSGIRTYPGTSGVVTAGATEAVARGANNM